MADTLNSFRKIWQDRLARDAAGLQNISQWDLFKGWEGNAMPEQVALGELGYALQIFYADSGHQLGVRFIQRCLAVCERVETEKLFEKPTFAAWKYKHGEFAAVSAYAHWLGGELLDCGKLLGASIALEEYYRATKMKPWDDHAQAHWLQAARTALIAGDPERARGLFGIKQKFTYHMDEAELLRRISESNGSGNEADLARDYREYFDMMRNPDYKIAAYRSRDIHEFETGCVWMKYFGSGLDDWRKVIDAVSR